MLVLKTDIEQKSRGMTLIIENKPNWIDLVPKALNDEITFTSITHDKKTERWLSYNGIQDDHSHDSPGSKLRPINRTNQIMVERGVTHIVINSTNYQESEIYDFKVI